MDLRKIGLVMGIGLSWIVSTAEAQEFQYPTAGACPPEYHQFDGICVERALLLSVPADELVKRLYAFRSGSPEPPSTRGAFRSCSAVIDEEDDDVLKLDNGAIVEIQSGYLGYIGYATKALLFKDGYSSKIWVEDQGIYSVSVLTAPDSCQPPASYAVQAAVNDQIFIINNQVFKAKSYCMGWNEGDTVAFLDGSAYGSCNSASLLNVQRTRICEVWCK